MLKSYDLEFDAFELTVKGKQLCDSGQVELGIKCFETALIKGLADDDLVMAVHNELGNAYFSIKDYDNSLSNYLRNLNLAKSKGDVFVESMSNGNISSVFKMLGKFEEAIIHCDRHLSASRDLNNKSEIAKALYNMGNIFYDNAKISGAVTRHDVGEFRPEVEVLLEKAAGSYKEALKANKKVNDKILQCKILGNYANIHYLLNNYKKSIKLNSEKLKMVQELEDKESERRTFVNRGNVYVIIKNYELAIQDYKSALDLAKSLNDVSNELKMLYTIANTYYISKQFHKALDNMLAYLSIVKNTNNKACEARANQCLSIIYAEINNYHISSFYSRQYKQLSQELEEEAEYDTASENIEKIANMVKYSDDQSSSFNDQSKSDLIILPMKSRDFTNSQSINLPTFIHVKDLSKSSEVHTNKATDSMKTSDVGSDDFFAILCKYQMQKLKEQNAKFDHNTLQEQFDNYISSSKKIFLDALVNSQSRRLDDQRATMPNF